MFLSQANLHLAHGDLAGKGQADLRCKLLSLSQVGTVDLHHVLVPIGLGFDQATLLADLTDQRMKLWHCHILGNSLAEGDQLGLALGFRENTRGLDPRCGHSLDGVGSALGGHLYEDTQENHYPGALRVLYLDPDCEHTLLHRLLAEQQPPLDS